MRVAYYSETDSLYIDLADQASVDSREVAPGVVLDLDDARNLVGIDVDRARRKAVVAGILLSVCILAAISAVSRTIRARGTNATLPPFQPSNLPTFQ